MKQTACQNISPYLINGRSVIAEPRAKSLNAPLPMVYGSCIYSGGHLVLSEGQRKTIASLAEDVLKAREACTGMPLGTMYDPARMPSNLRDAHKSLDKAVDALYRDEGFASDSERMKALFSLYGRMAEHSSGEGVGRWF